MCGIVCSCVQVHTTIVSCLAFALALFVQRVYYFWGLQQEEQGVVLPNGKLMPPRWFIRDMMWQVRVEREGGGDGACVCCRRTAVCDV